MKTVTEKYRATKAGKLAEGEFVRQMRLAHPTLITQFNGFKDTVQILRNKGMLFEEEYKTINISDDSVRRGIRYELTSMGIDPSGKVKSEDLEKAKKKATDNVAKDPLHYYNLLSNESSKVDKHDKYQEVKKNNHKDTFNDMKKADLKEEVIKEGTRAMIGYVSGDRLTTTYNHYDGYPSNLGKGLMTFYNDDEKAKDIAMKGYITGMDADTGEISATHSDPPTKIKLPEDGEEMAREVAEEIDGMGADYGYIWHDESNQWLTIKNTGIRSMIDQITGKMGVDTEVEEDIIPADEAVAEPTLKETLGGVVAFLKSKGAKNDSIKDFIKTHKDDIQGMSMDDVEDEYNNFLSVNTDYVDEKKGKDHDGDGDIDSDDYLAAKDKAIKKAMGKEVNEDADDEHMVHELIGDLFAPGNARSHLDFSVKAIAKALEDYKEDLTRQGVKDAMDLYDKLAADGTLDKEVEDGNGFISSKHVPKLKKAFELIGLYGKGINESVVKNNIKSIITKILEEEVINEAATNDLAKIAEDYGDFEGLKPAVIALQNIVTEIESFYMKTREKIQNIYNDLGEVKNEEGLKVGAFIAPSIENAFKRDLRPITKQQFHGGLDMPKVKRISESDPVMRKPEVTQMEAPKETIFTPVNEKK